MIPTLIRTRRLLLRPWRFEDLEDLLAYASDSQWARFLPVPQPYTHGDARRYIAAALMLRDPLLGCSWAIEHEGRAAGGIDLDLQFEQRVGTLAFSVARKLWGLGLMTETCVAVVDACFQAIPGLVRIGASVDPRNPASIRVLEKIGMTREGLLRQSSVLRGELTDELSFALLRDEWEGRR